MSKILILIQCILLILITLVAGCANTNDAVNTEENITIETIATEEPTTETTVEPTTIPTEAPTEPHTEPTTEPTEEPTEEVTEPTDEEVEIIMYFSEEDVIAMAKVLYNECRGIPSDMEKACVAWTACNRVDNGLGRTIYDVLTAPNQFAYWYNTPVRSDLYDLALDVLTRWNNEKNGFENVGRVLPSDYMFFHGDGKHNYFRNAYSGNYDTWDYSLDNPYES